MFFIHDETFFIVLIFLIYNSSGEDILEDSILKGKYPARIRFD